MSAHSSAAIHAPASTSSSLPSLPSIVDFSALSGPQLASSIVVLLVTLLLAEQYYWRWRKGSLPGNKWQIPIIGQFAESLHPSMEAYMRSWAKPLATVSVFNIFIVIASTTDYSRKILNASSYTEPCLVRSAKQILLPENWVFLNGKVHNEYRKGLNCLFTTQALAIYLRVQDRIYRAAFKRWLADPDPEPKPYWMIFRDVNMETSLRVFCGDYIAQENVREISDKYWQITKALELVNFPFAFPGTKVWHACRARAIAVKHLSNAAAASKKRMASGAEANCLLDAWVEEILAAKHYNENKHDGAERPNLIVREYSDHEMALVLLSFIFASQDAMSSSLTFGFQHLADYPEVLAKVREEQTAVRGDDTESPITLEWLEQMPYTNAVTREVLRHRPPVLMVPYLVKKAFPMTDDYTVPKGTMLIPSFWNSLHDPAVYPDPDEFIPERWMPGGANYGMADSKNWLVFGAGAHRCIAQNYVFMHMTACLGSAAMLMDWTHKKTPESDEIRIVATLFPKDGCHLKFTPRAKAAKA
ncbi:cytochrome P450 [Leucosporidium creatinivorum]|uniref:Cytochrome P450 n=1 Tax=Leucosporidium creatinivorum TaxID=106004 RepID=A0A1Y2G1R7_9BASI|nr:cytochrome P450 [Leucosporidium creatinivorum]